MVARIVGALIVAGTCALAASAGDREYATVMAWGKLQVYERGGNGKVMHRSMDPETKEWTKWEALTDKEVTSSPSALMTDDGNRLAVFFRGADGKLSHVFRDKETGWSQPIDLGDREMASGPTAVIAGGQLTVFARSMAGKPMQIYYDKVKGGWTDWIDID